MKTQFNRIALIPFHCTDCHRYVWLEKYRKADVWTNLPPCCPSSVTKKICKNIDHEKELDAPGVKELTPAVRSIERKVKKALWA